MPELKTEEAVQLFKEIIKTLVCLIEQKHEFFKGHSERVAASCVRFSYHLGMPLDFIDAIHLAGLLYDIGMVYPPIDVIHKQGKLTPEEMDAVKKHPGNAALILSHLSGLKDVLPIIRHHHEAYDGSGYPDGLQATDIPIGARILSVVDTFDALTSERPHRTAITQEEALALIHQHAGKLFDPRVAGEFIHFMAPVQTAEAQDDTVHKALLGVVESYKKGELDLFTIPDMYARLQMALAAPDITPESLAMVFEPDQSLHPVMISLANSQRYGGGGKIRTLRQAVTRTGIKDTGQIVAALSLKTLYAADAPVAAGLMDKLWKHAIATAYLCRAIGQRAGYADLDVLFVLGLTHDIGKVLLLHALDGIIFPQDGPQDISAGDIIANIQALHVGFSVAQLKRWGMSDEILRVIAQHELPDITPATPRSLIILHVANMLTRKMGYSVFSDVPELLEALKILGLDGVKLGEALQDALDMLPYFIGPR